MKNNKVNLWSKTPTSGEVNLSKEPSITYYEAKEKRSDGAFVIFPGGGYFILSDYEGKGYAEYLNSYGIDAFVVDYRVAPNGFPFPLLDARRSIRFVRHHAETYGIDPNKIAVMGSSAGGHLAALVSTYRGELEGENLDETDKEDYTPNYQVLAYPVINFSDLNVVHCGSVQNFIGNNTLNTAKTVDPILIADRRTPPAFIWHTSDDDCVNVKNSLLYGAKLRDLEIPFEMHIYPNGPHGLGLAEDHPYVREWSDRLIKWLKYVEFMK